MIPLSCTKNKIQESHHVKGTLTLKGLLTRPRCSPVHRGSGPSRGDRWHRSGSGTPAGRPCRRSWPRRAPRTASPGTRPCRRRHLLLGCTWLRSGTGSGCCSGGPRSRSHSLLGRTTQHTRCRTCHTKRMGLKPTLDSVLGRDTTPSLCFWCYLRDLCVCVSAYQ